MNMTKEDGYAIGALLLLIALVASLIYAWYTGILEALLAAAVIVILIIFFAAAIIFLITGTFFFLTKKDKAHEYSSMTLDDVTEVDREMEKK